MLMPLHQWAAAALALAPAALAGAQVGAGCVIEPGQCCFGKPEFEHPDYAGFVGPIAVMTASPSMMPGPTFGAGQVMVVYDLATTYTAPLGVNFNVPRYTHSTWAAPTLGGIFGVTLDGDGNIYTTSTSLFGGFIGLAGTLGGVYKIDESTSAVSVLATLPNAGNPGLGNIVYDCTNDQFFVTNHQDGRIWRLDSSGACQSTFDHVSNTIETCTAEAGSGFVPLGERVWGVTVHAGRVYYAVWNEDAGTPSTPNTVWSIGLSGTGDFLGAAQLEASLPPYPGNVWSMPGADIRFSPAGNMLVCQRGMQGNTGSLPHRSTIVEFVCDPLAGWTATGNVFFVGQPGLNGTTIGSTAGGVDVDYATGGRVWATGDGLFFAANNFVYGFQGLPIGGGTTVNSVLIDYQGNLTNGEKGSLGDVAVSCQQACMEIVDLEIDCLPGGDSSVTFNVTNNSGVTANYLLLPTFATVPANNSVTVSPNVIPLIPPLPSGSTTTTPVKVVLSGGDTGDQVCFDVILADAAVQECCATEICVELPKCCIVFQDKTYTNVACLPDGSVRFDWSSNLLNVSGDVLEHLFVIPLSPVGVTATPSYFDLPSVANGASTPISFSIAGVAPGAPFSFLITVHNADLEECCAALKEGIAPECPALPGSCCIPGIPCLTLAQVDCESQQGVYFPGVPCTTDPCGTLPGACCTSDGLCVDVASFNQCAAVGGAFVPGVTCASGPCANVAGACCLPPDGQVECANVVELMCLTLGGQFHPVEQCAPGLCLLPLNCACDVDGDNVVGFSDMTLVLLQWGPSPGALTDINGDGLVGFADLTAILLEWGPCH